MCHVCSSPVPLRSVSWLVCSRPTGYERLEVRRHGSRPAVPAGVHNVHHHCYYSGAPVCATHLTPARQPRRAGGVANTSNRQGNITLEGKEDRKEKKWGSWEEIIISLFCIPQVSHDWKFAAMVIDRMCLIVFTLFTVVATIAVLLSAPHVLA